MSNRSEMLHFRATPEEKAAIQARADECGGKLSDYMRGRLLVAAGYCESAEESHPPPDEEEKPEPAQFPDGPTSQEMGLMAPATYEQFVERRVAELLGDDASPEAREQAETTAQAEWITRDVR